MIAEVLGQLFLFHARIHPITGSIAMLFHSAKATKEDLEKRLDALYETFRSLAKKSGYAFRRTGVTASGKPTILLLGNHSSGKSSFINSLLDSPPIQNTGVAPTDDGFTLLLYGENENDYTGPAALGVAPKEFSVLRALGPDFLSHFTVKVRNREKLRDRNFLDSPGMIDAPAHTNSRLYNFPAAVRALVEISDLVLFLFDPEKPGTTSEAVEVLSQSLQGCEYKLRVLLNKADTLDSMDDYARAYGTLCWNLGRMLKTKDIPQISAVFTESPDTRISARIPLDSFDRQHAALLNSISSAGQSRINAIFAGIENDFTRLLVQAKVLLRAKCLLFGHVLLRILLSILLLGVSGAAFYAYSRSVELSGLRFWIGAACLLLLLCSVLSGFCVWSFYRKKRALVTHPNELFLGAFRHSADFHLDSLQARWNEIKDDCVRQIQAGTSPGIFDALQIRNLAGILRSRLPAICDELSKQTSP